jgi:uncharacterized protein YdeI (YjbR/CyaY-like superfamily)
MVASTSAVNPRFFKSSSHFRRWLETHHRTATELWVGFYKKASAKGGISYAEAVDQALCYGWIDGVKKRVDADAYTHRFSPRSARSVWSVINTRRAEELKRLGLMQPPGLAAFEKRDPARMGLYSFENPAQSFSPPLLRQLKANMKAWSFFEAQPPGYRRVAVFWVMSAKQEETRLRRLAQLIQASERNMRFGPLTGRART